MKEVKNSGLVDLLKGLYFDMAFADRNRISSQREFQLKVLLGIFLILLFWILVEFSRIQYRSFQIEEKKQWFLSENERLTNKNQDLARQYEYYKTDYFFRKEAKRKLNRKEPGERVLIVTGGDSLLAKRNAAPLESTPLEAWWKYFFGE